MANLAHPSTQPAGNRDVQATEALAGLELLPTFAWDHVGQPVDRVRIVGAATGSGDALVRLPYRILNPAGQASGVRVQEVAQPWVLDVDQAGIDLPGRIGGRVDGTTLVASEECAVWGFVDPWDLTTPFRGYGTTRMPLESGSTTASALGAVAIVTVGSPTGLYFPVGARVRIVQGTVFNTGTVTVRTTTTVTVQTDALYGAGLTLPNAALAAAACTIRQIDGFRPLTAEGTPYGGYSWCYLGSLSNSAGPSAIRWVRTRGTWRPLTVPVTLLSAVTGTAVIQLCAALGVPPGARRIGLNATTGSGAGFVRVGPNAALPHEWGLADQVNPDAAYGGGQSVTQTRDTSIRVDRGQIGGAAWSLTMQVVGHESLGW
jgi:hypothetical protein